MDKKRIYTVCGPRGVGTKPEVYLTTNPRVDAMFEIYRTLEANSPADAACQYAAKLGFKVVELTEVGPETWRVELKREES